MIHEFRDDTRWLSNFTKCKIEINGVIYPSVENAYMSMKSRDKEWKKRCVTLSPAQSKVEANKIQLRENWDEVRIQAMNHCLKQKFNQEPFKSKLIATGNENIQEGNVWNDTFWGIDLTQTPNVGENHLGRLIMNIRETLKDE